MQEYEGTHRPWKPYIATIRKPDPHLNMYSVEEQVGSFVRHSSITRSCFHSTNPFFVQQSDISPAKGQWQKKRNLLELCDSVPVGSVDHAVLHKGTREELTQHLEHIRSIATNPAAVTSHPSTPSSEVTSHMASSQHDFHSPTTGSQLF
ncbi:hypothetical protein LX36DRAFT_658384 [Colletotrichum falcatum]|nr:hypothetical protein LX36DRAFT_658384 [Colletotrichum falcatum]